MQIIKIIMAGLLILGAFCVTVHAKAPAPVANADGSMTYFNDDGSIHYVKSTTGDMTYYKDDMAWFTKRVDGTLVFHGPEDLYDEEFFSFWKEMESNDRFLTVGGDPGPGGGYDEVLN